MPRWTLVAISMAAALLVATPAAAVRGGGRGGLATASALAARVTGAGDVGRRDGRRLVQPSAVPEPATLALLGAGVVALAGALHRRRG